MEKKFDIPINLKVYAKTEQEAEYKINVFMRDAIRFFDMDKDVFDYEFFEFIPEDQSDSTKKPPHCGRGKYDCCKG